VLRDLAVYFAILDAKATSATSRVPRMSLATLCAIHNLIIKDQIKCIERKSQCESLVVHHNSKFNCMICEPA